MQGPPSNGILTTDDIQQRLAENAAMIQAIYQNQNIGKLTECTQYLDLLQRKILDLARLADAQSKRNVSARSPAKPTYSQPSGTITLPGPQKSSALLWNSDEKDRLQLAISKYGTGNLAELSRFVVTKSPQDVHFILSTAEGSLLPGPSSVQTTSAPPAKRSLGQAGYHRTVPQVSQQDQMNSDASFAPQHYPSFNIPSISSGPSTIGFSSSVLMDAQPGSKGATTHDHSMIQSFNQTPSFPPSQSGHPGNNYPYISQLNQQSYGNMYQGPQEMTYPENPYSTPQVAHHPSQTPHYQSQASHHQTQTVHYQSQAAHHHQSQAQAHQPGISEAPASYGMISMPVAMSHPNPQTTQLAPEHQGQPSISISMAYEGTTTSDQGTLMTRSAGSSSSRPSSRSPSPTIPRRGSVGSKPVSSSNPPAGAPQPGINQSYVTMEKFTLFTPSNPPRPGSPRSPRTPKSPHTPHSPRNAEKETQTSTANAHMDTSSQHNTETENQTGTGTAPMEGVYDSAPLTSQTTTFYINSSTPAHLLGSMRGSEQQSQPAQSYQSQMDFNY